jgi:hypothetical protein
VEYTNVGEGKINCQSMYGKKTGKLKKLNER